MHVLPEEGRLDGKFVGEVLLHRTRHALKYPRQPLVVALKLAQLDDTHDHHRKLLAVDAEHAIAHDVGAGVDSHYYPLEVEVGIPGDAIAGRGDTSEPFSGSWLLISVKGRGFEYGHEEKRVGPNFL